MPFREKNYIPNNESEQVGEGLSVEFLRKMERFYRRRASTNLHTLMRALEAQMRSDHDPELSGKINGVVMALEALER